MEIRANEDDYYYLQRRMEQTRGESVDCREWAKWIRVPNSIGGAMVEE